MEETFWGEVEGGGTIGVASGRGGPASDRIVDMDIGLFVRVDGGG